MRSRTAWLRCGLFLLGLTSLVLAASAQTEPAKAPPVTIAPLGNPTVRPGEITPVGGVATPTPPEKPLVKPAPKESRKPAPIDRYANINALSDSTQRHFYGAMQAVDWLWHAGESRRDGAFHGGYIPGLNRVEEDDHFVRQAAAAFSLARAARFTGERRHVVQARFAILTLMARTTTDKLDGQTIRHPAEPSLNSNRLAGAGYLLMAIHELPEGDKPDQSAELFAQSRELCLFIRSRYRNDGTLNHTDEADGDPTKQADFARCGGPALCGLAFSRRHKAEDWKTDLVRRLIAGYRKVFDNKPSLQLGAFLAASASEMHDMTRQAEYADICYAVADRVLNYQSRDENIRRRADFGGFRSPTAESATAPLTTGDCAFGVMTLTEALRTLSRTPKELTSERFRRYRESALHGVNHLLERQYTKARLDHIMPTYRPYMQGAFHSTAKDGDVQLTVATDAVAAMIQALQCGIEVE